MISRLPRRLLRHHLPLGLLTVAGGGALYVTRSPADIITRLSFASAWTGLVLITATLLIGPIKQISRRRMAVSQDFRRDVGIWAGMTGLFHAVIGNCVHLRGRPWLYYIYEKWQEKHVQPFRHDMFGFANYTGLTAALVLLALLATSNDASLRALGTPGWKRLQRWNYASFGLLIAHTLAYQVGIERPIPALISVAAAATLVTLALQGIGFRSRRSTRLGVGASAREKNGRVSRDV